MTEIASKVKQPFVVSNGYVNGHVHDHASQQDAINWDAIITEDNTPVDDYTTEQHRGLLTSTLYDSWAHSVYGKAFIVAANVGIFSSPDHLLCRTFF